MSVIGYIRVSSDKQDFDAQKHLLLDYAQRHKILIDELLSIEISSRKNPKQRRIDELLTKLQQGDMLLVAELSRLGRNMLETLSIINSVSEKGVQIVFVRQPELSTTGPHVKLLLAIYSYFAETEREFISVRTKDGLAAAKAQGKQLGRPHGSKSRNRVLAPYKEQIKSYLKLGLDLAAIRKLVNPQLQKPVTYNTFKYFVQQEAELVSMWRTQRANGSRL
jgi:DNA invertase Pin-like site-specific DNA recombinase